MSLALTSRKAALLAPWLRNPLWAAARAVPSLDLRFADSKSLVDATTGQNLVTFTRASGGTYVDSQGVIRNAVTNLLVRSEEFDNAAWTLTGIAAFGSGSVANTTATAAPNGTLTADKIVETSGGTTHLASNQVTITTSTVYTLSVYAKAAERSRVALYFGGAGGAAQGIIVNLTNGTFAANIVAAPTSYSITPFGNGWYRISITATSTGTAATHAVYICNDSNAFSYSGDGTSGIYIWGAQLEQSSTVGEYVPTGATINSAPRFDHNPTTGESLGLLVEEQRQNLLLNSGTLSTQNVTVTAVAHTLSFTGTGTITLSGTSTAGPLVGTGTGEANRVSLTFTPTAGTLTLTVSGTVTNAQLEIGSFRTSYIPTAGTAATRSADVCSITGSAFSGWYRQDEGTFFTEASKQSASNGAIFEGSDGSTFSGFTLATSTWIADVGTRLDWINRTATLADGAPFFPGTVSATALGRIAATLTATQTVLARNGAIAASTSGSTQRMPVNSMFIGARIGATLMHNGHIRRLAYWGQRLPNNVLQAITQ